MTEQNININVNGKYEPAEVTVKQGVPAQLTFTRTSTQGCLEHVHSTDLGFATDLPINQPQTVTIPTDQAGEFTFTLAATSRPVNSINIPDNTSGDSSPKWSSAMPPTAAPQVLASWITAT